MKEYTKILLASVLIGFSSLGLGRFAFGMILPNLQENLALSTTQAGFIGTANFFGYFVGILFTNHLYNRFETYKLIPTMLLLQAFCLFSFSFASNYLVASLFYTFSGFFSAITTISIMVYISHIMPLEKKGKALGIVTMGNGLGIIVSGLLVPILYSLFGEESWRVSWILFSSIIIFIAYYVRHDLRKYDTKTLSKAHKTLKEILTQSRFWKIAVLYTIFGISYVIYVTFFITASIEKYELSSYQSGFFWMILGITSLASGPLFGAISDKIGGYKTLSIIYLIQSCAMIIMALNIPSSWLYLSALLFGLSAWCIPSIIALLSSIEFDKQYTAQIFSLVTLLFAVGQAIAPVSAGYLHDIFGNFNNVFIFCASLTFIGAIVAKLSHRSLK